MANVLVVANQTLTGEDLAQFVKARMDEGACAFTLVVPATARADLGGPQVAAPPYAVLGTRDTDDDYALARRQLNVGLTELRRLGASRGTSVTLIRCRPSTMCSPGTRSTKSSCLRCPARCLVGSARICRTRSNVGSIFLFGCGNGAGVSRAITAQRVAGSGFGISRGL